MGGPDPIAVHDQQKAEMTRAASVVGAYWTQLRAEGVDDYDATRLALAFQRRLIFPGVPGDTGDEEG